MTKPMSQEMRQKLTMVDDMSRVIERIVMANRAPTVNEAMNIARVLGFCFPTLHENSRLFAAFVNALPVGPPDPADPSEF